MGLADALILLGISYGSEEAVHHAEKLASFIQDQAHAASEELAHKRGSFPHWLGSTWDTEHHRPMRNAACTTMAPTGTLSILASCSSGIEPVFSFVSRRKALEEEEFIELHPLIKRLGTAQGWLTADDQKQFRPNNPVTRAEFVTAVNKMLGRNDAGGKNASAFKDVDQSHWAYDAIMEATRTHTVE